MTTASTARDPGIANRLFRFAGRLLRWPLTVLVRPYPRLNGLLWDLEYALGVWRYLDRSPGRTPVALIDKYADRPRILDLGCGTSANLPLVAGRYRHYHGVDISRSAIRTARRLRRPDSSYEVADVLAYRTTGRWDVILLREVLYYFPLPEVAPLLRRLAGALTPNGTIIVSLYDTASDMGRALLQCLRECGLTVREELAEPSPGQPSAMTIVLAAPPSGPAERPAPRSSGPDAGSG
jgi:SAM-dependent methyltransferase